MNCSRTRTLTNKTLVTFMILSVLSLGMMACGDKTPSEKAKATGDAVGDAAEATGDAVGDAMQATGEFLTQSKETDVKAAREALVVIEKKWQDLLAEAAPNTDEAKVEFQNAKDQMAETLAKAKATLVEAENASGDEWQQNVKPALDATLHKAQKLYEDASARFGSK
jgi:hypothetical protein